jgi:hypothetical protein
MMLKTKPIHVEKLIMQLNSFPNPSLILSATFLHHSKTPHGPSA